MGKAPKTGEVGHFEIPADNPNRARKFYEAAFGWKLKVMEDKYYTMVRTGPVYAQGMPMEPGFFGGGMSPRGKTLEHPGVTINVDSIDDAV